MTLNAEGYYVVASEGKYKVTGAGDVTVEFIQEAGFVGTRQKRNHDLVERTIAPEMYWMDASERR